MDLFNSSLHGDLEGVMAALSKGGQVTWKSSGGVTPLYAAAWSGRKDICALLLAHGSNVNDRGSRGDTPLLAAAGNGHTAICSLLLAHGGSVGSRVERFVSRYIAKAIYCIVWKHQKILRY